MDELRTQIEHFIAEENADIDKYREFATLAKQRDKCEVAGVICDIIRDEESHVKHLEYLHNMLS